MNKTKKDPSEPDMAQLDVWYALTINPDNTHQYKDMKTNRLEWVYSYIQNYHMSKLNDYSDYILYPEISNPSCDNKNGITRIHFHGKIRFTSIEGINIWYSYIQNGLKDISMVKFDSISDKETWKAYCTKNKGTMQLLCQHNKVPYTMTDLTPKHRRVINLVKEYGIEERSKGNSTRI